MTYCQVRAGDDIFLVSVSNERYLVSSELVHRNYSYIYMCICSHSHVRSAVTASVVVIMPNESL